MFTPRHLLNLVVVDLHGSRAHIVVVNFIEIGEVVTVVVRVGVQRDQNRSNDEQNETEGKADTRAQFAAT